jgi:hypothetical protein
VAGGAIYGYALTAESGVAGQAWTIITTLPDMISATVTAGILVFISLISIRFARTKLPYELWHLIHLSGYLALLLGYGHQVTPGANLSGPFAAIFWPALGALVIAGCPPPPGPPCSWRWPRRRQAVTDGAVATSGDYERGAHVRNPRTGRPAGCGR